MQQNQVVIKNFFWRFFERCGSQIVSFVVTVVLARLLAPSDYGELALVTVFICLLQVFVDGGLGNSLIQKKDADSLDFSTVFYFNFFVSLILYGVVYVCSPYVADFYGLPRLSSVMRVVALSLVVQGVSNVQHSYMSKRMIFKKSFIATLIGIFSSAFIGILLAYTGYGVWALVGQYLTNAVIVSGVLWLTVGWKPTKEFSVKRLGELWKYGWKILVASLMDTVFNQLRQLVVGKKYSPKDLGLFNQGSLFPKTIVANVDATLDSVLFPAMSNSQNNLGRVRDMTRRAIKVSSYIMHPLMIGLAVCADSVVSLILSEKWLPCVPYLRIFCFTSAFWTVHTANQNAIKALGRSDLFLLLEVIKIGIGITALLITMDISVMAMAYSMLVTSVLSQIINAWPNKKLLNYSYLQQVKDMLPQITLSLVMGAIVYLISFAGLNDWVTLALQIVAGFIVYAFASWIFKMECFTYVVNTAKVFCKRK